MGLSGRRAQQGPGPDGRLRTHQLFSMDTDLGASRGFGSIRVGLGLHTVERSHPAPPPRGEAPGLHLPPRPKSEDRDMGTRGLPGRAVPGAGWGVANPGPRAGSCREESSVRPRRGQTACEVPGPRQDGYVPGADPRSHDWNVRGWWCPAWPGVRVLKPVSPLLAKSSLSAWFSLCADHGPGCPLRTAHRLDRRGVCQRPGPTHAPFLGTAAVINRASS